MSHVKHERLKVGNEYSLSLIIIIVRKLTLSVVVPNQTESCYSLDLFSLLHHLNGSASFLTAIFSCSSSHGCQWWSEHFGKEGIFFILLSDDDEELRERMLSEKQWCQEAIDIKKMMMICREPCLKMMPFFSLCSSLQEEWMFFLNV
jgi:hypothetical protein